jgi:hypothetical protein
MSMALTDGRETRSQPKDTNSRVSVKLALDCGIREDIEEMVREIDGKEMDEQERWNG